LFNPKLSQNFETDKSDTKINLARERQKEAERIDKTRTKGRSMEIERRRKDQ
jgi:hypothetical protein